MSKIVDLTKLVEKSIEAKVALPYSQETPILLVELVSANVSVAPKANARLKPGVSIPKGEKPTAADVLEGETNTYLNFVFARGEVYASTVGFRVNPEQPDYAIGDLRKIYSAITSGKDILKDFPIGTDKEGYTVTANGKAVPCKTVMDVINFFVGVIAKEVEQPKSVWLKLQRDTSAGGRANQLIFGKSNFIAPASSEIPETITVIPGEVFDVQEVSKTPLLANSVFGAPAGSPLAPPSPFSRK